ncbi:MAG TPA: hypothetical protein EYP53_07240 [Candidatus Latescibacteria bacterium]|nr:hypothetical protein [Candidatus Latescibacterota bacterium]
MDCKESRRLLNTYLDGLLSGEERKAVDDHLAVCEHCRTHYRLMEGILVAVESEPILELGEDFTERVMAQVLKTKKAAIFSFENILLPVITAAAACVGIGFYLLWGRRLMPVLLKQGYLLNKISDWLLLAFYNWLTTLPSRAIDFIAELTSSKTFEQSSSIFGGLLLAYIIYQLVSLIYDNTRIKYMLRRFLP